MAQEKIMNTRIQLKYDTLAKWQASAFNGDDPAKYLKAGEVAIVTLAPNKEKEPENTANQHPLLFKVGTGSHKFNDLPWVSALAADVYDWAKKEKLELADLPAMPVEDSGTGKFVTDISWDDINKKFVVTRSDVEWSDINNKPNLVNSVTAADGSLEINPTTGDVKAKVKISKDEGNILELTKDGLYVPSPAEIDLDGLATEDWVKRQIEAVDIFETDILTVDKFGGIDSGANLNGMTTHAILEALLYPYIAFVIDSSSRSAKATTLENGATQTLNSASVTITKKSKPITSVKLLNDSTVLGEKTGNDVANGGTIAFDNLGITVTKTNNPNLKFVVTDGQTSTEKTVGASTFVYPYYMGECAADATIDETLIDVLTKKVESKGNKTVTHTCENGRMIIAYPKAHGVLKSILDPNNFETIGDYTRSEVSVTGLDGTAQDYYVYASGAATVTNFKVQYKY